MPARSVSVARAASRRRRFALLRRTAEPILLVAVTPTLAGR